MTNPRLLFVTSRFPYPLVGGPALRVFNLLAQLARHFDVSLITLRNPSEKDYSAEIMATGIRNLVCIPHRPIEGVLATAAALPTDLPLNVAYYKSGEAQRAVDRLVKEVDVGLFHLIRSSNTWTGQRDIPVAIDMCDAIGANFQQTAAKASLLSPWRIVSAIDAPRTIAFEQREINRFNLVSIHTRKDAERVGIPEDRVLVSTQGVDVSVHNWLSPNDRTGSSIALIGKMDFFPNYSSAIWFAREVLPLLEPEICLKIIGFCPPKVRAMFEGIPRVVITGRVESLDAAAADCFAAIAPMRVATGIQNKVLEYFAMGMPAVISREVSLGLLDAAHGSFQLAESPQEWAERLSAIRADRLGSTSMAMDARNYVNEHHNWDRIGTDYAARLRAMLG